MCGKRLFHFNEEEQKRKVRRVLSLICLALLIFAIHELGYSYVQLLWGMINMVKIVQIK